MAQLKLDLAPKHAGIPEFYIGQSVVGWAWLRALLSSMAERWPGLAMPLARMDHFHSSVGSPGAGASKMHPET